MLAPSQLAFRERWRVALLSEAAWTEMLPVVIEVPMSCLERQANGSEKGEA